MKKIIYLYLATITILTSCQTDIKDGVYRTDKSFSGYELLIENKSFKYDFWTCTGGTTGKGKWDIKNDSIELIFEEQNNISKIDIVNSNSTQNDSIIVSFVTLDEIGVPFFDWVYLVEKTNSNSSKKIDSVFTDLNGKGSFKLKKNNNNYGLLFNQFKDIKLFHPIVKNKNQKINASIYRGFISIISDTILKYDYKTYDDNITLIGIFENGLIKNIELKKIKTTGNNG